MRISLRWAAEPEEHDYAAAVDYLSLLVSHRTAQNTARQLQDNAVVKRRAKDIIRASRLPLLPADNAHVVEDMRKDELSPVLLVRTPNGLEIADGYHRVCAVYHLNEDDEVHCKLTSLVR